MVTTTFCSATRPYTHEHANKHTPSLVLSLPLAHTPTHPPTHTHTYSLQGLATLCAKKLSVFKSRQPALCAPHTTFGVTNTFKSGDDHFVQGLATLCVKNLFVFAGRDQPVHPSSRFVL